jgi:hypothetical protein
MCFKIFLNSAKEISRQFQQTSRFLLENSRAVQSLKILHASENAQTLMSEIEETYNDRDGMYIAEKKRSHCSPSQQALIRSAHNKIQINTSYFIFCTKRKVLIPILQSRLLRRQKAVVV